MSRPVAHDQNRVLAGREGEREYRGGWIIGGVGANRFALNHDCFFTDGLPRWSDRTGEIIFQGMDRYCHVVRRTPVLIFAQDECDLLGGVDGRQLTRNQQLRSFNRRVGLVGIAKLPVIAPR